MRFLPNILLIIIFSVFISQPSIAKNMDGCFDIDIRYKFKKITPTGAAETPLLLGHRESFNRINISSVTCTKERKYSIFIEPYTLYKIPSYIKIDESRIIHSDSFDGYRIGWYAQ